MILKRDWANDIEVADQWLKPATISQHRIYVYWEDRNVFPCDERGVRLPKGFASMSQKFFASPKSNEKIFVFGGSTSFGWFLSFDEAWPQLLQSKKPNALVFNFGVCGSDITQSLYLLIDCLRDEMIPDRVIFLDGVNEKQGYIQARRAEKKYSFRSNSFDLIQSRYFNWHKRDIPVISWIKNKLKMLVWEPENKSSPHANFFIDEQVQTFQKSKNMVISLANKYKFKAHFFLQPSLWDVLDASHQISVEDSMRKHYLNELYNKILSHGCHLTCDLRKDTKLKPSDFFDWQHLTFSGNQKLAEQINRSFLGR